MNDGLLDFVKGKLEEGEGLAPDALARLVAAAGEARPVEGRAGLLRPFFRYGAILAASLAAVCCGWFVRSADSAQRELEVSNVIALLQVADGSQIVEGASLAERLLSWQDAPCDNAIN